MNAPSGFVPRIDKSNYRALERVLAPRSLFSPMSYVPPWSIVDGAWLANDSTLLDAVRAHGGKYIVDTMGWRFQDQSAWRVKKLVGLAHAPDGPLQAHGELRSFIEADLRFQAALGADAYLVPSLMPLSKHDGEWEAVDGAASAAARAVCMETPKPVIATLGVHTQSLPSLRDRLAALDRMFSMVYVQFTPVAPYADSAGKLEQLATALLGAREMGFGVIAGRMAAMTAPLLALGADAVDGGLGAGETFRVTQKLSGPSTSEDRDKGDDRRTSLAKRRYVVSLRRSLAPKQIAKIEALGAASDLIRCDDCCRFLAPDDRIGRGREHSLIARITEAAELSELPSAMRVDHVHRAWTAARNQAAALNRVLEDSGEKPMSAEYLDNQLAVLATLAARSRAA